MTVDKWTVSRIGELKGERRLASLTAYDYAMARLLDEAGVPLILVGDSLGMVVLGYEDTTRVTLEDMEHHLRAVARARPRALLAVDLPYHSYETPETAVASARRLMAAGAEAVKAEGGQQIIESVRAIVAEGIPFLGHIGMLPQHVREEGGYKIKGKTEGEHAFLLSEARVLEAVGAFAVVLELVKPRVAAEITAALAIPTIGIGSGPDCDGQILVTTDLWGLSPDYIPRHVEPNPRIREEMRTGIRDWMAGF